MRAKYWKALENLQGFTNEKKYLILRNSQISVATFFRNYEMDRNAYFDTYDPDRRTRSNGTVIIPTGFYTRHLQIDTGNYIWYEAFPDYYRDMPKLPHDTSREIQH